MFALLEKWAELSKLAWALVYSAHEAGEQLVVLLRESSSLIWARLVP